MTTDEQPYIVQCSFCENGLLRFMRCVACNEVSAVCDECELIWTDIEEVQRDPNSRSSGAFPACPACESKDPNWVSLDTDDIESAGLGGLIAGDSL